MNKNRAGAIVVILVAVLIPVLARGGSVDDNLVRNPSFEEGTHLGNWFYQDCIDGAWWEHYLPIETALEWEFYFAEGCACASDPNVVTGRPEANVITSMPDPLRVRNGLRAFRAFTFWRCHSFWLQQTVELTPTDGVTAYWIEAEAYVHSWYSDCSTRPHDAPYWDDCTTPAGDPFSRSRICVAPTGVFDPRDPAAVCSEPVEIYGVYGDPITLTTRIETTGTLELMVWSQTNAPLKHEDWYVDDVALRVTLAERDRVYLPIIYR